MIQANTNATPQAETVRQSAGQVVHDVVTLAELQVQLFKSDTHEAAEQILRPLAAVAVAFLLLLGALLVGLMAIALGLVAIGLSAAAAYALTALLSIAAAAATAAWAWRRLGGMPPTFARSREELERNISWVKEAVTDLASRRPHSSNDWRTDDTVTGPRVSAK